MCHDSFLCGVSRAYVYNRCTYVMAAKETALFSNLMALFRYINIYAYTYIDIYMYVYTYTCIYIYVYIYVYR